MENLPAVGGNRGGGGGNLKGGGKKTMKKLGSRSTTKRSSQGKGIGEEPSAEKTREAQEKREHQFLGAL